MSHLLEILGQGLPGRLMDIFDKGGRPGGEAPRVLEAKLARQGPTAELQCQLGWAQLREECYDRAAQSFGSALKCDPDHVRSLLGMACHQAETGRLESAVELLQKVADGGKPPEGDTEAAGRKKAKTAGRGKTGRRSKKK